MSISTFSTTIKLYSPDTKNEVEINTSNQLSYSVKRNGDIILAPSLLSMQVGSEKWGDDNQYIKITKNSFNEEVDFVVPRKFNHIKDSYNQLLISYKDYNVEFRAYNDGVAYRFIGKTKKISTINDENVQYNFAQNYLTYTLLTNKLQNWFEKMVHAKRINMITV